MSESQNPAIADLQTLVAQVREIAAGPPNAKSLIAAFMLRPAVPLQGKAQALMESTKAALFDVYEASSNVESEAALKALRHRVERLESGLGAVVVDLGARPPVAANPSPAARARTSKEKLPSIPSARKSHRHAAQIASTRKKLLADLTKDPVLRPLGHIEVPERMFPGAEADHVLRAAIIELMFEDADLDAVFDVAEAMVSRSELPLGIASSSKRDWVNLHRALEVASNPLTPAAEIDFERLGSLQELVAADQIAFNGIGSW